LCMEYAGAIYHVKGVTHIIDQNGPFKKCLRLVGLEHAQAVAG
jgi:hypothetical protein